MQGRSTGISHTILYHTYKLHFNVNELHFPAFTGKIIQKSLFLKSCFPIGKRTVRNLEMVQGRGVNHKGPPFFLAKNALNVRP